MLQFLRNCFWVLGCDIEQKTFKNKKSPWRSTPIFLSSLSLLTFLPFRHEFLFFLTEPIAIPWTYTRRTCRGAWRGGGWASCWLTRPSSWLKSAGSPSAPPAGTSPAISVGKRTALPKIWGFFVYVLYSTLLHLPPLRFHCVGGCWGWNPGMLRLRHWQSDALTTRLDLIHNRLDLIHKRLDLISARSTALLPTPILPLSGDLFVIGLVALGLGRGFLIHNAICGYSYFWKLLCESGFYHEDESLAVMSSAKNAVVRVRVTVFSGTVGHGQGKSLVCKLSKLCVFVSL